MSNRRSILFLLVANSLLAAGLWFMRHRAATGVDEREHAPICGLGFDAVVSVEVSSREEGRVVLSRGTDRRWRIVEPFEAEAEPAPVERLLDAMLTRPATAVCTASELDGMKADLSAFSLSPSARLLVLVDDSGRTSRVHLGAVTPSGREVYARVEGMRGVFALEASALEAASADADRYRCRSLFGMVPPDSAVAGIDIRLADAVPVRLARGREGWQLESPTVAPADEAVVAELASRLLGGRIESFDRTAPRGSTLPQDLLASRSLAAAAGIAVTLRTAEGLSEQVVFGSSVNSNLVWALIGGGTSVVKVDSALADLCRVGASTVRDTRVFPLASGTEVENITVESEGTVYVLGRDAGGAWRLESPMTAPADQTAAAELLDRVLKLRRDAIVDHAGADVWRVSVKVAGGEAMSAVAAGRTAFAGCASLADLRGKEMLSFKPSVVRRLARRGRTGGESAVLRDDERGVWVLDGAAGARGRQVEGRQTDALVAALSTLRAARVECVAATPADFRRCGLEEPFVTIAVDVKATDAGRWNVLVGSAAPGGGRYATVSGSDTVFVLSEETARILVTQFVN